MKTQKLNLSVLIVAALAECAKMEYGPDTIANCNDTWIAFERYCNAQGKTFYEEQMAAEFLHNLFDFPNSKPKSRMASSIIRSIRMLGDYNTFGRFLSTKNDHIWVTTDDFQIAISNYIKRCKQRNNTDETIQRSLWSLYRITEHFVKNGVNKCKDITPELVSDYVCSLIKYTKKSMQREVSILKTFLNLIYLNGQIDQDLSLIIPKLYHPNKELPNKTWSTENITNILSAVERNSPVGKRDYCILLIAARYGIRTEDIQELRLHNIHWENSYIEFIQQKTKTSVKLPLLNEVGEALIDYLKYARPTTSSDILFVKFVSPFDGLKNLYTIFQKYLRRANISVEEHPYHGLHSLRHSLATTLLENGVEPIVISDILGHISPNSIKPYLKINIEKLKECALTGNWEVEIYE